MRIVNGYTIRPIDLQEGDVMIATVVLRVKHHRGANGELLYSVYSCPYPNPDIGEDGTPQGMKLLPNHAEGIAEGAFRAVALAGGLPAY